MKCPRCRTKCRRVEVTGDDDRRWECPQCAWHEGLGFCGSSGLLSPVSNRTITEKIALLEGRGFAIGRRADFAHLKHVRERMDNLHGEFLVHRPDEEGTGTILAGHSIAEAVERAIKYYEMDRVDELKTEEEFECGLMVIDWNNKTWTVNGLGGHSNDQMTPERVLSELRGIHPTGFEFIALVGWKENSDGYQQVCFYDLEQFEENVYGSK